MDKDKPGERWGKIAFLILPSCLLVWFVSQGAYRTWSFSFPWQQTTGVVIGALVLCVLMWQIVWRIGGNKVIRVLLIGGYFLAFCCACQGWFMIFNGALDSSKPSSYTLPIMDKKSSSSSKGGTFYYLHINDPLQPGHIAEVEVSERLYEHAKIGQMLKIKLKAGLFRVPWIYGIVLIKPSPSRAPGAPARSATPSTSATPRRAVAPARAPE